MAVSSIGDQRSRPAGAGTPRASSSWVMAASVVLPARWISAIPPASWRSPWWVVRTGLHGRGRLSDASGRAELPPRALADADAALVRSLMRAAF